RHGSHDYDDLRRKQALASDYEIRTSAAELDSLRREREQQTKQFLETNNAQSEKMLEGARKHYAELAESTSDATAQADAEFHKRYEHVRTEHARTLSGIQQESSQKLRQIRQDTAQKLAAYRERQS